MDKDNLENIKEPELVEELSNEDFDLGIKIFTKNK